MMSNSQNEKIVRSGGSGGVDVSQTKKAPAETNMHANSMVKTASLITENQAKLKP